MAGLFDDLIPAQSAQAPAGLFDDLIPAPAAAPAAPNGNGFSPLVPQSDPRYKAWEARQKQVADAEAKQQAAFDATRTPLERAKTTAAFVANLPVRMLTKGEHGLGDLAEMIGAGPETVAQLRQHEADFIRANQGGLEAAQAVGDVLQGIPQLSELGAVPGQLTKITAASAKAPVQAVKQGLKDVASAIPQAVRDYGPSSGTVERLASSELGAGKIPSIGAKFTQNQNIFRAAWDESVKSLDDLINHGFEGEKPAATRLAEQFTGSARPAFDRLVGDYKDIIEAYKKGDRSAAADALRNAVDSAKKLDQLDDSPKARLFTQHARFMANKHLESIPKTSAATPTAAAEIPPAASSEGGAPPSPPPPGGVEPPPAPPSAPPPGGEPPVTPPQFAFKTVPGKNEVLDAAERLGIDIPEAVVAKPANQQIAAAIQGIPGGGKIKTAIEKGVEDIGARAAQEVNKLGSPGIESAGESAKGGILDWIGSTSKKEANALYEGLNSTIDQKVTRPLKATAALDEEFKGQMLQSTAPAQAKARELVSEALARPEGLNVQGLRDLRTYVGDQLDWANLNSDPSKASLKRLYGALTQDLRATVRRAGGNSAMAAFDRAEAEHARISGVRRELQKIVGVKGDVGEEAVVNKMLTMPVSRLQHMKNVLGADAFGDAAAEIASRMGMNKSTGLFSHDRYLTAYGKMSEARKQLLFGESKRAFDDIALVATKFNELTGKFNRSNTAYANFAIGLLTNLNKPMTGAAQIAGGVGAIVGGAPGAGVGALLPYIGKGAGMAAIRRVSGNLASPAVANRAARIAKSLYNVESASAFDRGARAIAAKEATLQASIKAYAATVARETGQDAAAIEASINKQIDDIRKNPGK